MARQNKTKKINRRGLFLAAVFCLVIIFIFLYKNNQISCKKCNVIWINFDSLAATHMPCYGYNRNTTPNMCDLANKSVLFTNNYSVSNSSLSSNISLLTGLYPQAHKIIDNTKWVRIPEDIITAPRVFKLSDYTTNLYANETLLFPTWMVENGFNKITTNGNYKQSLQNENILDDLKKSRTPFFAYANSIRFSDPYLLANEDNLQYIKNDGSYPVTTIDNYYKNSPEFSEFAIAKIKERLLTEKDPENIKDCNKTIEILNKNKLSPTSIESILSSDMKIWLYWSWYDELLIKNDEKYKGHAKDIYDEALRQGDEEFGRFLKEFFSDPKIYKKTILVITSNHGEALQNHEEMFHCGGGTPCLYQEIIKTPMMVYIPGVKHKTINRLTQSVDVLPMLIETTKVENYDTFQGINPISWWSMLRPRNFVLAIQNDGAPARALIFGKWKLMINNINNMGGHKMLQLYNLKNDPEEKTNLASAMKNITQKMLKYFLNYEYRIRRKISFD